MKKLNKKIIKLLVGIGMFSCLVIFSFNYYNKNEIIKANPTEEITIDKGSADKFIVPKDAIGLIEPELKENDLYEGYVQGNSQIINLTLGEDGFSGTKDLLGHKQYPLSTLIKTNDGNFVQLIAFDGTTDPNPRQYTLQVIKIDSSGHILKRMFVPTGQIIEDSSTFMNENAKYFNGSGTKYFAANATNFDNKNGTATIVYGGTNYSPKYITYDIDTLGIVTEPTSISKTFGILGVGFTSGENGVIDNMSFNPTNPNANIVSINNAENGNTMETFKAPDSILVNDSEVVAGRLSYGENRYQRMKDNVAGTFSFVTRGSVPKTTIAMIWGPPDPVTNIRPIKNQYEIDRKKSTMMELIPQLSTDKEIYYTSSINSGNVEIVKYDLEKNSFETIRSFPSETKLKFFKNDIDNQILFIGSAKKSIDENFKTEAGLIVGKLDINFNLVSVSSIQSSSSLDDFNIAVLNDNSNYLLTGSTTGRGDLIQNTMTGEAWVQDSGKAFFSGVLNTKMDYSPIIKATDSLILNVEEKDIFSSEIGSDGYTNFDRFLLSGSINGLLSLENTKAVQVYDDFDLNDNLNLNHNQEWLNNRINRNPNKVSESTPDTTIPWSDLGIKVDESIGPNQVTYFVTDSQKQITSTSRWVNKVDKKTKYEETTAKAALHAENFTIKLSDLKELQKTGGLTQALLTGKDTTSKYGNVLAWGLDAGTNYNADVEIEDQTQLAAINAAKKFDKFPLTYTLTKNGKTLTRETIVYVMGDNSEQVGKNGTTIFNTEPISLPWDITSTLQKEDLSKKVMSDGKVVAYDFETGKDITATVVSPVEADITALQTVEPIDKSNPPAADKPNPIKKVHYEIKRDTADESKTTTVGTPVTVYYRFVTVTINSNDEDGNALYDKDDNPLTYKKEDKTLAIAPIVLDDQIVGKTINFTTLESITESKTATTNGTGYVFVDYFKADNKTKVTTPSAVPIQWKDADAEIDPNVYILQYKGLLRFITIPATMKFDSKNIRAFDQESSASKDNSALIVGDNRKTTGEGEVKGNWKVTVNVVSDFTLQEEGSTATLPGILYYGNTMIKKTEGTTIKTNSTATTKIDIPLNNTSSFKLKIPAGKAQKGTYQATVNWGLTNAP